MGKYDYVDGRYFLKPDRVADLLTVGLYRRRLKLAAGDLAALRGQYPTLGGTFGRLERDGLFLCEKQKVKYGVEIETFSDYGMPRRFLGYDACDYEGQAEEVWQRHKKDKDLYSFEEKKSRMKAGDFYYPVINVLLYLGQGHWRGRSSLREMFSVPERILPYVHDKIQNYSFGIIEADHVVPSEFETDLRQFFEAMQCRSDKNKLRELFRKKEYEELPWDAQCAIAVHLNIKELKEKVVKEEENMCKAYRDLIKEEREEARKKGYDRGISQGIIQSIRNLMQSMSWTAKEAMNALLIPEEEQRKYSGLL